MKGYPVLVGTLAGSTAYLIWGVAFLYWYELRHMPAADLLAYRILSSLVFLLAFLGMRGELRKVASALRDPALWRLYGMAGIVVAVNWGAFMYASVNGWAFEASLGYFLVPLVSIALGTVILRERLDPLRAGAILCALVGLGNLFRHPGDLMVWVPLTIGLTFGYYGYLKKVGPLTPLQGLLPETVVLTIPAVGWLMYSNGSGPGLADADAAALALIAGTGLLSITPLILFTFAAMRLQLVSMGFLQYITPSTHFVIGVFVFARNPSGSETLTFGLIWVALGLAAWSSILRNRRERAAARMGA